MVLINFLLKRYQDRAAVLEEFGCKSVAELRFRINYELADLLESHDGPYWEYKLCQQGWLEDFQWFTVEPNAVEILRRAANLVERNPQWLQP